MNQIKQFPPLLLYKEQCRDLWAALVVSLQSDVQGCSPLLEASIKNVQCKISAKEVRVCVHVCLSLLQMCTTTEEQSEMKYELSYWELV